MGLRRGSTAVGLSSWIDPDIPTITMGFESHYDIGGAPASGRPCPSPLTVASSSDYTIRAGSKPGSAIRKRHAPPHHDYSRSSLRGFFLAPNRIQPGTNRVPVL